jgi:hypothetical protein
MRLINAGVVQELTGLTADQLREWTTRRDLIKPDLEPNGPGSRARYAWQTVLLLRLAVALRQTFHVELQAQRSLFIALANRLAKAPFPALQGTALVVRGSGTFDIVPLEEIQIVDADVLIIRLDPHLDVLSVGFGLNEPMRQLPLFPAVAVR